MFDIYNSFHHYKGKFNNYMYTTSKYFQFMNLYSYLCMKYEVKKLKKNIKSWKKLHFNIKQTVFNKKIHFRNKFLCNWQIMRHYTLTYCIRCSNFFLIGTYKEKNKINRSLHTRKLVKVLRKISTDDFPKDICWKNSINYFRCVTSTFTAYSIALLL